MKTLEPEMSEWKVLKTRLKKKKQNGPQGHPGDPDSTPDTLGEAAEEDWHFFESLCTPQRQAGYVAGLEDFGRSGPLLTLCLQVYTCSLDGYTIHRGSHSPCVFSS